VTAAVVVRVGGQGVIGNVMQARGSAFGHRYEGIVVFKGYSNPRRS